MEINSNAWEGFCLSAHLRNDRLANEMKLAQVFPYMIINWRTDGLWDHFPNGIVNIFCFK